MAMGYEIAVTPVQLATAYASIANGGELLQPALVKEIRDPDGHVLYRHARRVVRRVMTEHAAAEMRHMLLGVVENGTAVQADLANYQLGGKTGTPRRTVNGRYAPMQYNPNFVGLFPGDAPQFVIVVKLDNPKSSIYSGKTAAPLTKTILEAAIAARDAALDRDELARRVIARAPDTSASALALANARRDPLQLDSLPAAGADSATPVREAPPVVDATFALPLRPPPPAPGLPPRPVPDVHALPLRDAVRALHDAGFRVQLVRGASPQTWPAAGVITPAGAVVRLQYDF
jgi:cell division protein FtsI (penicillin-binding protein 3)